MTVPNPILIECLGPQHFLWQMLRKESLTLRIRQAIQLCVHPVKHILLKHHGKPTKILSHFPVTASTVEISREMPHAPPVLHKGMPRYFILHGIQYALMAIRYQTNNPIPANYLSPQQVHEPTPVVRVLPRDQSKGKGDQTVVRVARDSNKKGALKLPCQKGAVHGKKWTTMLECFDTRAEAPKRSSKHWVFDVFNRASISWMRLHNVCHSRVAMGHSRQHLW